MGFALLATGALDDSGGVRYKLQLDNSYGLTEGSDVRVAGVRAGIVEKMRLNRKQMLAEIEFELTERGFGDLRKDVTCETRPQSLIGEYFIDCDPGKSREKLDEGDTIPVSQSASVVPPDLVANIMRRPYRERFSILLSQLGQRPGRPRRGPERDDPPRQPRAARGEQACCACWRSSGGRSATSTRTRTRSSARSSQRRRDVGRFVEEARDTTRAYATEAASVDDQFRQLPTFLGELQPTLAALEGAAEAQRPALESLRVSARPLAALLRTTGNFSTASRPSVRALAALARSGEGNLERSLPNLKRLTSATRPPARDRGQPRDHPQAPQRPRLRGRARPALARRARLHRARGVPALPLAGLADQQLVRQGLVPAQERAVRRRGVRYVRRRGDRQATPRRCRAWLGPNQPGITSPDPTKGTTEASDEDSPEADAARLKSGGAAAKPAGAGDEPLLDYLLR